MMIQLYNLVYNCTVIKRGNMERDRKYISINNINVYQIKNSSESSIDY